MEIATIQQQIDLQTAKNFESPQEISFTVYGLAQPAGSKRPFAIKNKAGEPVMKNGRPLIVTVDANPNAGEWKQQVAKAARVAYQGQLIDGPVSAEFNFFRPRPAGHFGQNGLNKKGRETNSPVSKPDLLKLARGVEDALTGIVWRDDSQIVTEALMKLWGEPARVEIIIRKLEG